MNIPTKQINIQKILDENNIYLDTIHHNRIKKRSIFPEKFSESIKNNFQDDRNFSEIYSIENQKNFDKNSQINNSNLESLTNNFLKMILVQIKNQDPTHPIDNNHLTSQMTQMHTALGIEKLSKIMQEIKNTNNNTQAINLSNWIGHTIMISGNPVVSFEGKKNYGFKLASKADHVILNLTDTSGNSYVENYYNLKPGIYKLNINNNRTVPEIHSSSNEKNNIFRVSFEAFNNNGDRPEIYALKSEKINNIIFKNGQSKLALEKGNLIDVKDVISIE
ncbi:FlgD family flagellar basal-body rod modification protein [Wigglesworthia glossinidia endosymbiont of Glossina morsitans morsitans (Yale colony)]|uniref:Basal-body rod modification protein FlgD n=1 Tax=Wigglesworthia glossinidia endosymbiont of Glossina morsitans morsitans (Yale colony) TaxID=1142511 RepID=H6Q5K0_WIGGL|nr:flagellar hook capping FlgD N-terminal domain-containing protein [Wigglesworthia glossinidia]AFA40904.1 FlgD family flagellar basal-body rod modification protein [Wigglesworthia glossinidia endosymbiont of Glossina morsitans morsitans (Yale colony)]